MGIKVTHGGEHGGEMPHVRRTKPTTPFGLPKTPFDPRAGQHLPLSPDDIQIMTVVSEEDDYLVCLNKFQRTVNVAKPYMLRRTPFDGETVEGMSYTYSDANSRLASLYESYYEYQYITPNYYEDELILAVKHRTGIGDGCNEIQFEDLNTCGRCWAAED